MQLVHHGSSYGSEKMFLWAKGSAGDTRACNELVLGRSAVHKTFETRRDKGRDNELFLPMETVGMREVIALMVGTGGLVTRRVTQVGPLLNNERMKEHMLGRGGTESGDTSADEWAPLPKIPEKLETAVPGKDPCFIVQANVEWG
ncbi:hypothetical protein TRVL_02722 [Trypanosoma vivax]|nr:hypothetical protein TRVL_02722 [Trypanosoma vivax]